MDANPLDDPLLLPSTAPKQPPPRWRWYILVTYTISTALQGIVWALPGMTSQTMRLVYNITADTTDLFINYGNIFFLALALPFMYVIDKYGCRTAVMFGCVAVFACNLIRCFANNATTMSIWILHASFILNSIVGPVAQAVPSKLAEDWFPPEERTTATAVGALGNQCGTVLLDLLLPFVVPDDSSTSVADATHQQFMLNIILTAMSGLPLLMALIYFPNRPEHSPSASAELAREDQELISFGSLLRGLGVLLRSGPYVLILLSYSLLIGLSVDSGALLTDNLGALTSNSQAISGWAAAAADGGGFLLGLLVASWTDAWKVRQGRLKRVLVVATFGSGLFFVLFSSCLNGVLPAAQWGNRGVILAICGYVGASMLQAIFIPLMFDLASELSFGVAPEGTVLTGLTLGNNIVSMLGLLAPSDTFFVWVNWANAGLAITAALALGAFLPTSLPKFEFDQSRQDMLEQVVTPRVSISAD